MSHHESHFSKQIQQSNNGPSVFPTVQHTGGKEAADLEIAKLAFAKFEARGCAHGFDKEDWSAASRELGAKEQGRSHPAGLSSAR